MRARHALFFLLAPAALVIGTVGASIAGNVHPLAEGSDNFGQSLEPFGSGVGVGTEDAIREATARTRRWTKIAMEAPVAYAISGC